MTLSLADLFELGQYTIDILEDPKREIDIRPEILNELKKQVTITKRVNTEVPEDNPELDRIYSYFKKHREIVDEVVNRTPMMKMDIEYTVRFISSNQKIINEILNS